jgi:hypothetical protein
MSKSAVISQYDTSFQILIMPVWPRTRIIASLYGIIRVRMWYLSLVSYRYGIIPMRVYRYRYQYQYIMVNVLYLYDTEFRGPGTTF